MTDRLHPFDLMFRGFAAERFPAIRDDLADRRDIASFLLSGPALELLRELRPDDGLGEGADDFVALVHAAWLYWLDGEQTLVVTEADLPSLLAQQSTREFVRPGSAITRYIQVPPRRIWAAPAPDEPYEPLDGWFDVVVPARLRVVACFGLHAERPGITVIAVEGAMPATLTRPDGSAPYSPTMPGGDLAGLFAIAVPDELLQLGWRTLSR